MHLASGLTESELRAVEERFGFTFCAIHRELLHRALPVDGDEGTAITDDTEGRAGCERAPRWPDWRSGPVEDLRRRLAWPIEGVLFDVQHNDFWSDAWGHRPTNDEAAQRLARQNLRGLPPMVPLYGHRYLPSAPCPDDPPVFSIHQSDVIYYGDDLIDYLAREFKVGEPRPSAIGADRRVPFWSDLVGG